MMLTVVWIAAPLCSLPQSFLFQLKHHPLIKDYYQCTTIGSFQSETMVKLDFESLIWCVLLHQWIFLCRLLVKSFGKSIRNIELFESNQKEWKTELDFTWKTEYRQDRAITCFKLGNLLFKERNPKMFIWMNYRIYPYNAIQ